MSEKTSWSTGSYFWGHLTAAVTVLAILWMTQADSGRRREREAIHHGYATFDEAGEFVWLDEPEAEKP